MQKFGFTDASVIPYVLLGVLAICMAGLWWLKARGVIVRFFGKRGGRIYSTFRVSCFITLLALVGLGIGLLLAGPYMELKESYPVYEPLNVTVVTDISASMLAQAGDDACGPSRLNVMTAEVQKFTSLLKTRKASGHAADKLALVLFARFGYRAIPIHTEDYALFDRLFAQEMLPENVLSMLEGTNHWHAVERALETFKHDASMKRVMVILTDGEPDGPEKILIENRAKALRDLSETGPVAIYIIGVGDPGTKYLMPLKRLPNGCPDMEVGYKVQQDGPDKDTLLDTRTDVVKLQDLARELGGTYRHSYTGQELSAMLTDILDTERIVIESKERIQQMDLTEYVLMATLVLLGLLMLTKTP